MIDLELFLGLVKDDTATLQAIKISKGSKLMVVGSTLKDVETVKTFTPEKIKAEAAAAGCY